ncbi:MAG: flagellar assembly peptidoglycan hydrolase FlgJ [Burkholderiaceae bacterium]|nr:flagellar assembly peptidoglycan hydrolase FlgJ [Burkholderiaceae bacterium]
MALPAIPAQGLALDARALDGLRRDASADPRAALRQAASQFEALFMQQLLKSMREAMPRSGMFGGTGHDTYVGMLDQQLSQSLAGRPGGLAETIARQLSRQLAPAGTGAQAATPATAPGGPRSFPVRSSLSLDPQAAEKLKDSLSRRLDGSQAGFVARMWPHALAAQRSTGVPAAFVVGQAALESGWGRQEIRHPDGRSAHNLFGIKAGTGWKGATVEVATTEYVDGKPQRTVERFRAYGSYEEAFRDWASLMSANARYAPVLRAGQSVSGYASGMQRAGYATDPRYGEKLERTINQTLMLGRLTT